MANESESSKIVGNKVPCNTIDGGTEIKQNYNKKSTSIFMTIANENMKNIEKYVKILRMIGEIKYLLIGKHDGPKLEHYHVYCMYTSTKTFNSQDFDYSHIKKVSSPQATVKYILCEDKKHIKKGIQCKIYLEIGERPKQGGKSLKQLMTLSKEERKELPPCQLLSLIKCESILKEEENVDAWLEVHELEVEWHMGMPRSGKTYYAKSIGREYRKQNKKVMIVAYDKSGFAHKLGTDDAELLILNEFRDSCMAFKDFLEILTDEHQFNTKHGGFYMPNLKKIIITTVQSPLKIYKNIKEDREQIYGRITKIFYHSRSRTNQDDKWTYHSCEVSLDALQDSRFDCDFQQDSGVTCPDDSLSKVHGQDVLQHVDLSSLQWV